MFLHRDLPLLRTGVQVPAGTCRPGEDPRDAVLRETREETSYDCFAVRRDLGVSDYRVGAETHVRHFFAVDPTAPLPDTWESAETHDGLRPATPLRFRWIPLADGHVLSAGLGAHLADLTGY